MKNTERLFMIAKEVLSVFNPTTIKQLVEQFGVSENTAKNDLLELESQGVAYCANPNGKPQLWFAVQNSPSLEMTLELAIALSLVSKSVQRILPPEIYRSIEHVFDAANATCQKKRTANHQSKVIRFERAVGNVDLNMHTVLNNIRPDVFNTVKSAICSDCELHFKTPDLNIVVSRISLIELKGQLFIRGMSEGKQCHLAASDILAARESKPLWQESPRRAA
ncbi:DeoR family transcriptional regulator [Shewanella sp. LC6]|uniref:DeoR family transcriptional regulator n=1 Tax=unclassified Shewanella TaxID=196818 RepID=UPI00112ED4B4|nr:MULTISPECIES: DeoR family transcriptional regulator [unclassified Shewanella]QQK58801.1 DeoR family transcriptional regulator [Shewanella sp. LC6]TPE50634.1 DeoR family transcriptional regulator [Shewanella sp. LC2]